MTKIERYLAAKEDAIAVRAALTGANPKVEVSAMVDGGMQAGVQIVFAFPVSKGLANSIAKAVGQNAAKILADAVVVAEVKQEQARLAAVAEANEVLQVAAP